jgi:hypothetical protein
MSTKKKRNHAFNNAGRSHSSLKLDGNRNADGTFKVGNNANPTGKGGLQERPEDINFGGRKLNIKRPSWWYDTFGRMNIKDVKAWNNDEPKEVVLDDGEVVKKEWKSGYSELAYNAFIRARKSLRDLSEITDRTEGKATQRNEITGADGDAIQIELVEDTELKDANESPVKD